MTVNIKSDLVVLDEFLAHMGIYGSKSKAAMKARLLYNGAPIIQVGSKYFFEWGDIKIVRSMVYQFINARPCRKSQDFPQNLVLSKIYGYGGSNAL